MNCWKCKKEMVVEHATPWRKNHAGDKIYSMTLVCWECGTIFFGRMTEINRDFDNKGANSEVREEMITRDGNVCNDNMPEKICEGRAHMDRIL